MSRPAKIALLALVVVVVIGAVTGIALWTAGNQPGETEPGLYENGKKIEAPAVMVTIGGYEVSFDDYRHYYLLLKATFDMYYGDLEWDNDPDGEKALVLRKSVETELLNLYAWLQIAEEEGIVLDQEDLDGIQATLDEQKETHGDKFESYLAEMFFLDEAQYLRITELQTLAQKASEEYAQILKDKYGDELGKEADAAYEKDMITAKHILIKADVELDEEAGEAEQTEALDAAQDAALEKAEQILAEIRASEDPLAAFDEAMHEYSEDTGLETYPDGYTFGEGEMVEIFYETAKALEVDEISEPVWSDAGNYRGYHIILRVEQSDANKEENRTQYVDGEINTKLNDKVTEVTENLVIDGSEYYLNATPQSVH